MKLMSEPVVWADRLTLTRGLRDVLLGVSFELGPGEVLAVLGPNGAGKSSLLKTLATLSLPTQGRLEILGRPVKSGSFWLRRHIGWSGITPTFTRS